MNSAFNYALKDMHPDKPGKLAQSIPIYGTILGQCTLNRANAGPIFLVCRDSMSYIQTLFFRKKAHLVDSGS